MYLACFCWSVFLGALLLMNGDCQQSICQTMQYRQLSFELQNEHQCMILENLKMEYQDDKNSRQTQYAEIISLMTSVKNKINHKLRLTDERTKKLRTSPALKDIPLTRDCHELKLHGIQASGVYPLKLPQGVILNTWCDMDTNNGGWTVIQRRMDGSVNFTRKWNDYAFGFGNTNTEYWLGNENIYQLTRSQNYTLRVDLWDWEDNYAYAQYDIFILSDERNSYRLYMNGYNGTAGDSMSEYHNHMKFSTPDRDLDLWYANCAQKDQSGWWFNACGWSSLNGLYIPNGTVTLAPDGLIKGIIWFHWKDEYGYSMKRTEMKIKPRVAIQFEQELLLRQGLKSHDGQGLESHDGQGLESHDGQGLESHDGQGLESHDGQGLESHDGQGLESHDEE